MLCSVDIATKAEASLIRALLVSEQPIGRGIFILLKASRAGRRGLQMALIASWPLT